MICRLPYLTNSFRTCGLDSLTQTNRSEHLDDLDDDLDNLDDLDDDLDEHLDNLDDGVPKPQS